MPVAGLRVSSRLPSVRAGGFQGFWTLSRGEGYFPTVRVSPNAVALLRCHTVSVRGSAAVLVVDDHDSFRRRRPEAP